MHPHRGIETITSMIRGGFRHRDSRGGGGLLTDGCVQWMTAGRGIQHSEMPERTGDGIWGYQLWLNLPRKDKLVPPRYQHLSAGDIPSVAAEGAVVKVVSASFGETQGPARNWVRAHYLDAVLERDSLFRFDLEKGFAGFLYLHTGSAAVGCGGKLVPVRERELAELEGWGTLTVRSGPEGAGFLLLASRPNREPIARGGPFVMNTEEEIRQAWEDYGRGVLF